MLKSELLGSSVGEKPPSELERGDEAAFSDRIGGERGIDRERRTKVLHPSRGWEYPDRVGMAKTEIIIDLEQRKRTGVIDLGDYRRPHGMDLDPRTGRMVVTIENPDGLLLIDPAARKVLRKYDVEGADPHMVILGPKAEWAYVSNTATAAVAAVHLETGDVSLIPTGKRPQGAVRSHDGKLLYVTNSESSAIAIIDMQKKENVEASRPAAAPDALRSPLTAGSSSTTSKAIRRWVSPTSLPAKRQRAFRCLDRPYR